MSNLDTATLIKANELLGASIQAIDAYVVGNVKSTEADVRQMADLTCHALLLSNLVAKIAGRSLEELSDTPLSKMPGIIQKLSAAAMR